jgi:hypothetical protein
MTIVKIKIFMGSITAAVALFAAGCNSVDKNKPVEFTANDGDQVKKIATTYADDILTGMQKGDYKLFSKNLTSDMKQKMTEKIFTNMHKDMKEKMGELKAWTFLTPLEKPPLKVFVWKVNFSRQAQDKDKKDIVINNELLFTLIVGKNDAGYTILGFGF